MRDFLFVVHPIRRWRFGFRGLWGRGSPRCWAFGTLLRGRCRRWFYLELSVDVHPTIDARARGRGPDRVTDRENAGNTVVFLTDGHGHSVIDFHGPPSVGFRDQARLVSGVKDGQVRIIRVHAPHAVVVHGQRVDASACHDRPDLDGLVRRSRQQGIAIVADENIPHVVGVSHELGNAFAGLGVPQPHDTVRPATGQQGASGAQGIDRALDHIFGLADVDLQRLARPIQIPEAYLVVQPSRRDPVGRPIRRGETLDVVAVGADSVGLRRLFAVRSP